MHFGIGCEYRISYRVGVSYTFYAGSCRLPGIQSPTRTRTGVNGGQWLIVGSPDVGDGFELNPAGIFRVQFGGGLRFYF